MFCGGVFACKQSTDDLFICSDGVEMDQNELLNIVQGVLSLLNVNPLDLKEKRVLFVEAANTYIQYFRGYIFGASTYHNLSVPLLRSTLERVFCCVNTIFNGSSDIDLLDYSNRSILLHTIRHLLTNTPGGNIPKQIGSTINSVKDMTMNKGMSYHMELMASGNFEATAMNPLGEQKVDESLTETSVTDNSNVSNELQFPNSDGSNFTSGNAGTINFNSENAANINFNSGNAMSVNNISMPKANLKSASSTADMFSFFKNMNAAKPSTSNLTPDSIASVSSSTLPKETQPISISEPIQTQSNKGFISVKIRQEASFAVQGGLLKNTNIASCDNTVSITATGGPESGPLLFAIIPASLVENHRLNQNVLTEDENGSIFKCDKPLELLKEKTKVLLFQSPIRQEPPPFTVNRNVLTSGNDCKIIFTIKAPCIMQNIIIGMDPTGFSNPRSNDCEITVSEQNILLSVKSIDNAEGGETTASIIGNIPNNYTPPNLLNIRCVLRGTLLGGLYVKTHPEYNFEVKSSIQKLFIPRSVWDLSV